jgi:short-subunit dehydrogenase
MRFDNNNLSTLQKTIGWAAAGAGVVFVATAVYNELTKYKLQDRVVLITGGSRGLGLVLARQLANKGAKLVICARSAEQLQRAHDELEQKGAEVLSLNLDVTNRRKIKGAIREIIDRFGRLDVLINNAGIVQVGPYDAMGIKEYEDAMLTNFWGPLYMMHAVLPHFISQGEGRILNITSLGGKIAVPHVLPYTASKFALVGLSEGMHAELKKQNIHVTTVVPNLMRTGSPRNAVIKGNHEAEYALFKASDSSPLLSQKVEIAARNIIKALEYGESERILSLTAKLAMIVKGFAPTWVDLLFSAVNRFLPDNVDGGHKSKRGYEVESNLSRGPLATLSDRAAEQNNEL